MTMADTVAVMNAGRIEQQGAPAELYDLPKTAFVARFLGQANMFDAEIVGADGDLLVVEAQGRRFSVKRSRSAVDSGTVSYGVRPEKLRLEESEPTDVKPTECVVGPGRVTDVSFTGVSTQYIVEVPGFPPASVFEQNLDVDPIDTHVGDHVWLRWNRGHAFAVASEQAHAAAGSPA